MHVTCVYGFYMGFPKAPPKCLKNMQKCIIFRPIESTGWSSPNSLTLPNIVFSFTVPSVDSCTYFVSLMYVNVYSPGGSILVLH